MRTTLTLEKDVAALLKRVAQRRKAGMKDIVNEALRHGLEAMAAPAARPVPYQVKAWDLGGSLLGSLDNVEDVLSRVEGEAHR